MNDTIDVLQLYPLSQSFKAALAERYRVHRWHEVEDRERFVAEHGSRIRAVVTGGHIGTQPLAGVDLPGLEIVAINGVGVDKVDIEAARMRGIRVVNTPNVLSADVADLALALVLALTRQIPAADRYVRDGLWTPTSDFPLTRRTSGMRYGVAGLGGIGRQVARRLEGFGGQIAYTARAPKADAPYLFLDSLEQLAAWSDVLILCIPAGPDTNGAVDTAVLAALGPTGFLVNVSRGSVVHEPALLSALQVGGIAGAGLDVFLNEPGIDPAFHDNPRVVMTPHMASATVECRRDMAELVLANLDAHFGGRPLVSAVV
jgi:lactate dehydrogenase-like 2-hydroxyacid dehydrogenase